MFFLVMEGLNHQELPPTWAALAHTVTGSNFEIADATSANTRWAGPA